MKTKVEKSKIHGIGIFAVKNIKRNEIIETCELIILDKSDTKTINKTFLYNYYFSWQNNGSGIALGSGSLYNHSYKPNAKYIKDFSTNTVTFVALKPVKAGCEITVNYNGDPKKKARVWFDK